MDGKAITLLPASNVLAQAERITGFIALGNERFTVRIANEFHAEIRNRFAPISRNLIGVARFAGTTCEEERPGAGDGVEDYSAGPAGHVIQIPDSY